MTSTDSLYKQLEDIRRDMRGLSPKTSTWRKLHEESCKVGAQLQALKDSRIKPCQPQLPKHQQKKSAIYP
jgi:hypothetical protein